MGLPKVHRGKEKALWKEHVDTKSLKRLGVAKSESINNVPPGRISVFLNHKIPVFINGGYGCDNYTMIII